MPARTAEVPVGAGEEMGKQCAFPWYGGKQFHLGFLLPLIPRDAIHYVEPFGGAASVLLNLPRYQLETFNDLLGGVVTFFRVLRDNPDELIAKLELTPWSREEFELADLQEEGLLDVELARRFLVRARQAYNGSLAQRGRRAWKYDARGKVSGVAKRWVDIPRRLARISERLQGVQIENRPALDVIRRHDARHTVFYVDPPYVHSARVGGGNRYQHEMSDDDHRDLADLLRSLRGRVVLSGYQNDLYDQWYADWRRIEAPAKKVPSRNRFKENKAKTEMVWCNFDPYDTPATPSLFEDTSQRTSPV